MSEEDRSRLYDWFCEHLDKPTAEYVMSCLPPAPLSDLVTKDYLSITLSAALTGLATKEDLTGLATKESVDDLTAEVDTLDVKLVELTSRVDLLVAQRDEDRRTGRIRHYWLAGIGLSAAMPIWLNTAGVIG
ncbi:MAG: hypothetical protein OXB99_07415 [Acidimicrobiaceae bacterium]|nr:hypothetical protein [Acidimicrobiaceae bacterium]